MLTPGEEASIRSRMDKGAHFFKCDFQVHTPRDAAWEGKEAATEAERRKYASELVRAARDRNLDAIAITDHHDFAFFPYVREAAATETDSSGQPLSEAQRLVVFPGVELTLSSPPCQAILLLDADFDESKLEKVLTTLAIDPTSPAKNKLATVETVSPTSVTGFNDLEQKLGQHKWLKGKFIILPNVTTKGHKTLFREGFQEHYKEMHCVGGYVDGSYSRSSDGHKNMLEGRQVKNGYKPIGVLQTSDNRRRDHADLGKHVTFVKWSEPTAEALRQACLARGSRLSLDEPTLPSAWITSLTVTNSKFLGALELDFNRQYNAVIGGRGTGKSTILEYLRWALCDQPVVGDEDDAVQKKRRQLIENTLRAFDGEVRVEFILNGVRHTVMRNARSQEISLAIGSRDSVPATEREIRGLLPIQAYSQKQLSGVGVRIQELRRFVELPIKKELDQIESSVRDAETRLRTSYGALVRRHELEAEISKDATELSSSLEQLRKLRKDLKGLTDDQKRTIAEKAKYDEEESIILSLKERLEAAKGHVDELIDALEEDVGDEHGGDVLNEDAMASIEEAYTKKFAEIDAGVDSLSKLFTEQSVSDIDKAVGAWTKLEEAFKKKYKDAKAKAKVNQQQLDQIQELEKRVADLKKEQAAKRKTVKELGDPKTAYDNHVATWNALHDQRIAALAEQCERFTALSDGAIRASIEGSLDTSHLMLQLKKAVAGMNIREEKIEQLCQRVATSTQPSREWSEVLSEFEKLALHQPDQSNELPNTPVLTACSFIDSERSRVAADLDTARWLDLSVLQLRFNPRFEYCTNRAEKEYIAFADASAGQQATAILTVLLNQPGAPLVIDQPEDDIDSKMFGEVVQRIWNAKSKRQLLFASHSANFVVNGDAELVACCDYVKEGDQTRGKVKAVGAIDNPRIKEEIILVTEGGRSAFKLRMDQYGF